MQARGTRELLRREGKDEQRVGERFGKGDEGGAGGLQQEGEHNVEQEEAG